jgi:transglutaminase-like putative cysteine protease
MTNAAGVMKRFTGTHRTTYTYSHPVFLDPHTIRLRPRSDPGQLVHDFSIDIDPAPAGVSSVLDAWGNYVEYAWFSGSHESLEITTRFDVERVRTNPYDFIVPSEEAAALPPTYPDHELDALQPYLKKPDIGEGVRDLATATAASTGNTLDFAAKLAVEVRDRIDMIVRPEGDPYAGQETLEGRRGSCRDMAVLYIEACRHVGIASRFVSGYVEQHNEGEPRDLHAWAGIYVPGGGWRGFDPTQGLAVSTGHVTLAVAGVPAGAASVTGTFVGADAPSELASTISFDVSTTS